MNEDIKKAIVALIALGFSVYVWTMLVGIGKLGMSISEFMVEEEYRICLKIKSKLKCDREFKDKRGLK